MKRIKNIGFVIIGVGAMLAVLFFAKSLFIQKNASPMTAGIQNPKKAAMGREDITITFASTMAEGSFYQGIVAAFEEQHPNIHVQVLPYSGEADPAELASQADTILLGSAVSAESSHLYLDLNPLMTADGFNAGDFWKNSLLGCQSGERQAGLPLSLSPNVIFTNKTILAQNNLPDPQPGWTMEAFKNLLSQIPTGSSMPVYSFVDSSPGFILRPATHARLAEGKGINAVASESAWYLELARSGRIGIPSVNIDQDASELIRNQQAAMWAGSLTNLTLDYPGLDYEIGVLPFPVEGDNPTGSNPVSVSCVVISAGTTHQQESWAWLNFLSRNGSAVFDGIPANRVAMENNSTWQSLPAEVQAALSAALENGWYGWVKYDFSQVSKVFSTAIESGNNLAGLLPANFSLADMERQSAAAASTPQAVATPRPTPLPKVEKAENALSATYFADLYTHDINVVKAFADEFNRANPQYFIEIETERVDFENIMSDEYDLENFDCFVAGKYLAANANSARGQDGNIPLYSLDPFLESGGSTLIDDIDPMFLNALRVNGSLYGIPVSINPMLVYYNASLLEELKLEKPGLDWTVDDFWALAQQAAGRKEGVYGYVPFNNSPEYYFSDMNYLRTQGGSAEAKYDAPEAIRLLEFLTPLAKNRALFLTDSGGTRSAMGNYMKRDEMIRFGQGLMWLDYPNMATMPTKQFRNNFEIGVAVYPAEQFLTSLSVNTQYISRKAENPQVCWAWMEFLGKQSQNIFSGVPLKTSLLNSDQWAQIVGEERAAVYRQTMAYLQLNDGLKLYPPSPFNQWWSDALIAVLRDGQDAGIVLKETQRKAQATLDCMQLAGVQWDVISNKEYETAETCAHQIDPDYHNFTELWVIKPYED